MAPPLLHFRDIALTFGGKPLLRDAEIAVNGRDRIALVGRNGSGKSTFLKIVAGRLEHDSGEAFIQPGTRVQYLPQEPDLAGYASVRDYANANINEHDDPYRVDYYLDALKVSGASNPAHLSGGERRRAALARSLSPQSDILLLDEPTNHLDLPTIEWLENEVSASRTAIVLISHDRRFLENLSNVTVWLNNGFTHRIDQGFDAFENWRDTFFETQARDLQKMKQKLVMEEDWLRYGVTARRKRNQKRLQDLHSLRSDLATRKNEARKSELTLATNSADASGKLVAEIEHLTFSYPDQNIVSGLSMRLARGNRLGIIGPNGSGKSTLLSLLTGTKKPDNGFVRRGSNIKIATLDQQRTALKPDWSLKEAITQATGDMVTINGQTRHVMSYLKDFMFTPEQANTPVHALSGGEHGRLMLARTLSIPSNLMILDEPTNDLDLETLDVLQEMLSLYEGSVILVSHDRDFLDRVVTSTLAFEGSGRWQSYAGGYTDMLAQRAASATKQAPRKGSRPPAPEKNVKRERTPTAKLTNKEQITLKNLPDMIARLESDIEKLNAALQDRKIYDVDPQKAASYTEKLADRQKRLNEAEIMWLELEERNEAQ